MGGGASEIQSAILEHLAEQREALAGLDEALLEGASDELLEVCSPLTCCLMLSEPAPPQALVQAMTVCCVCCPGRCVHRSRRQCMSWKGL